MLALALGLWNYKKLLHRNLTLPLRPKEAHFTPQSNEQRAESRRADEISGSGVAEDCVIAIVTRWYKRLTALILCQQTETGSVVPTPRTLAQISTDRAHVSDLRTCYFDSSLANHRKCFAHFGVVNQLLNRDQRSDP